MLQILAACVAMFFRDGIGTLLTLAEARGRATLAGALDALGDLATIAVTVLGAGAVIKGGITPYTITLVAAMVLTSFAGTTLWVRLGTRWMPENPDPAVHLK